MQSMLEQAPVLLDHLGEESLRDFTQLTTTLDTLGISYRINKRLVRGLDYYGKTVFEWVTSELGSQGTICAGGRYDGLIAQLGGKENFAIGFAMGMERILALVEQTGSANLPPPIDIYMIRAGETAESFGLAWSEKLRNDLPGIKLQVNCGGGSIKSQFKKADKSGACYAIVLGEDEVANNQATLKSLRTEQEQITLDYDALLSHLKTWYTTKTI
jgi:histidyl-tRNA synthetase